MRKCGKGVRQRAATREQDRKITLVYCDYAEKQSKSEVLQHKCMFSDTKTILGELKYRGGGEQGNCPAGRGACCNLDARSLTSETKAHSGRRYLRAESCPLTSTPMSSPFLPPSPPHQTKKQT